MDRNLSLALCALSALALAGCFETSQMTTAAPPVEPVATGDTLPVGIDEICAINDELLDEFGEDPGWIELANRSGVPVSLGAYRLRGRATDGPGWRLPDTVLGAGERLVVFLSGRDLRASAPAADSVAPAGTPSVWSDSLYDPPGFSAVRGLLFGKSFSGKLADGTTAYSFALHLADNSKVGLLWAGATAIVNFKAPVDASKLDRFWMRATIPAGQPLTMRLCIDKECWKTGSVTVTGTGDSLGVYEIPLSKFPIDLHSVLGIQFDPPTNRLGDHSITFAAPRFFRSPRRPHANFTLRRKGGALVLEDTAGRVRDTVEYPEILDGGSWFRDPSTGRWARSAKASPGRRNPSAPPVSILAAPVFATAAGFHAAPVTVRVAGTAGLVVRCALGGSLPVATSPDAAAGIRLDSSGTLACASFDEAGNRGPVATSTFLVGEATDLPVVSVSVDPGAMFDPDSGICSMGPNAAATTPFYGANFWHETELPVRVELFEGGARSFVAGAGLSIYGNWSRSAAKKAFAIQMREKYGASHLEWPLFPQHPELRRFKGFGLRANGSNYKTDYQRDALASSLTEGRGVEYQLARQVVLYINGSYWGIYQIRERLDADYLETRFGIDPSNVDLVKNNSESQSGSIADWNDLRRTLQALGPSDDAGWEAVSRRIDLDNFMDYFAAELFAQNTDWPANNVRYWRQRAPATPWRAMLFDLDGGLGGFGGDQTENPFPYAVDSSLGWDEYPNGPGSNVVLRRILTRPALRHRFINRFLVQLATNLSPERSIPLFDSVTASIRTETPKDVKRWKLSASKQARADEDIRAFLQERPDQLREHMRGFFQLDSPRTVALSAKGGTLLVEGMAVGARYLSGHFAAVPLQIEAVGTAGTVFAGWSDGETARRRIVAPGPGPIELEAVFR